MSDNENDNVEDDVVNADEPVAVPETVNDETPVTTEQPAAFSDKNGKDWIINENWKRREPMSGEWENKCSDICWNGKDCFCAFFCQPCYNCSLAKSITGSAACGLLAFCFGPTMCCVRGQVREGRKIEGSAIGDLVMTLICSPCSAIQMKREVLEMQ